MLHNMQFLEVSTTSKGRLVTPCYAALKRSAVPTAQAWTPLGPWSCRALSGRSGGSWGVWMSWSWDSCGLYGPLPWGSMIIHDSCTFFWVYLHYLVEFIGTSMVNIPYIEHMSLVTQKGDAPKIVTSWQSVEKNHLHPPRIKMWLQGWWLIGGIVPALKLFIKRLVWDNWKAFTYVEKAFVGPLPVQLNDWIMTLSFRMFPPIFSH